MVAELSDRIARRQALNAPLFGRNMLIARYDERSGVTRHCTPKGAHMLPQEHLSLGVPCSTPSYGPFPRPPSAKIRFIFFLNFILEIFYLA
jgi:hypothetical protein